MEPASYHPSGTYNLELGARFLENLWAPGVYMTEYCGIVLSDSSDLQCIDSLIILILSLIKYLLLLYQMNKDVSLYVGVVLSVTRSS
jgi:hypothetical protein